ncbi:septal ring lytic transglycosylase RlpA family protein [Thermomonas carbonis]|uniref:septal ring lytic transglycosylase RlpA family protein n=1 Tax=Thermomonas carbonis TaxID=1463158 RepID=UPI0027E3CC5D|nr:septal ring lytic transglycosylase RlpA family protein [Thermomonas carbonis]
MLLLAALPFALAACATTGTASKSKPPSPGLKVVVKPAGTVNATPPLQRPKASPYAAAQEDPSKRGDYVAGGLFRPGEADTVPDYVPDVDAIPEPEVRDEPRSRAGNRKTYSVLGKRYEVLDSAHGYAEDGLASYYGKKFHGRRTSNQEVYDMYAFTAAHKTLPLPSFARVTNLDNGRSIVVRVNDRGPFHAGRVIDLSYAAAVKLGYRDQGTARVRVEALTQADGGGVLASTTKPAADTAMDRLVEQLPEALASAGAVDPSVPTKPAPDIGYRFDMQQNGKVMSADEFDAWMQSRRVRVATGKPGKPDPVPVSADAKASAPTPAAVAPPPPSPVNAAALVAATTATPTATADDVTLQVASFANQQNAQQALAMLHGAAIARARLFDADVNGKKIWRLRIGPVAAAHAPELAARIVGLGFGQPQRVRD